MASRLWRFLTTDISELLSGDTVDSTAEAAEAVFTLAEVLQEDGANVEKLAPLVGQMDSLLDALNSPLAEIIEKSLPFVPIATGLLKFYLEKSKRQLSLANCVAIAAQAAYLESFKSVLAQDETLQNIGNVPASEDVKAKTKRLAKLELSDDDAAKTVTDFPNSTLAKQFGAVLKARLLQVGLTAQSAQMVIERVAWRSPRYLNQIWAASTEAIKHLGQPTFEDWQQEQTKYQSIEEYLTTNVEPGPQEKVFNEKELSFCDIYVPLKVKLLNREGKPCINQSPQDLENWVTHHLMATNDEAQILFIQGEAGRGKSVFCRMFADWVRRCLYPAYTPILIRLRSLKVLENNLTQTLANTLETHDFVSSDSGWLTDKNTRFLFLLDGFDELLLEGRETGGLKEFLPQVVQFQQTSHHRFLITGRPLSLQGIERVISQSEDLQRAELQTMSDDLRARWYSQWAAKFGQAETDGLKNFLSVCPADVNAAKDALAREPLLLYLLGRMHREQRLNAAMFEGAQGTEAKVVIYDEAVRWVIEEQRQDENFRQVGLEAEDLRRSLTEVAVCVMQSGNEIAKVSFLEARLQEDGNNPVSELLTKARQEVNVSEKKLLNNLLTSFYIKPASGDREGSVEFAHKSFGEFLFAERLKDALEDWSRQGRGRRRPYEISDGDMHWELYDLLGYGALPREVVSYLSVLLAKYSDFDPVPLFNRLHDFYLRWWDGEFIDARDNNLPHRKTWNLRDRLPEQENPLELRQVDVLAGINVMILLFELHRYGQARKELTEVLSFHPCGEPGTETFDDDRLYRIIGTCECLQRDGFKSFVGLHLSCADLRRADLSRADLRSADLRSANLSRADLRRADLRSANLRRADLRSADLRSADLRSANLSRADLSRADLSRADLNRADLSRANLISADLISADLRSTDLISADLISANLRRADFRSANLRSANLRSANLHSADFRSANLSFSILLATDFRESNNLTPKQFKGAKPPFLCNVALPAHIAETGIDRNRDCDQLPKVLGNRYEMTLEETQQLVDKARQKTWG
ncbi:MAG: pentapeptide repeat-containing protein [Cyanobacteria bacterium P01_E01_bin.6]